MERYQNHYPGRLAYFLSGWLGQVPAGDYKNSVFFIGLLNHGGVLLVLVLPRVQGQGPYPSSVEYVNKSTSDLVLLSFLKYPGCLDALAVKLYALAFQQPTLKAIKDLSLQIPIAGKNYQKGNYIWSSSKTFFFWSSSSVYNLTPKSLKMSVVQTVSTDCDSTQPYCTSPWERPLSTDAVCICQNADDLRHRAPSQQMVGEIKLVTHTVGWRRGGGWRPHL